jgi:transposase-like protein
MLPPVSIASQEFQLRFPKLSAFMGDAEANVLAFMNFGRAHWPQLHSTNLLEREQRHQPPRQRRRHLP